MPTTPGPLSKIKAVTLDAWLGALLTLGVGVGLYVCTDQAIENDAQTRFTYTARTVQASLDGRIKSYADLLRGISGLFLARGEVTRDAFRRYVSGLDLRQQFPGIESMNFGAYVADAERDAFDARMLANVDGRRRVSILPAGRRADYTVLTFVEPATIWSGRIGIDLQARPAVALALAHARDSGELSMSGTVLRVAAATTVLGMRMPVYRSAMPVDDVAQRRAAYVGSVGIAFCVERLAQGVLDNMPLETTRLIISGMSPAEEPGGPPGVYRRAIYFDSQPGAVRNEAQVFRALLPVGVTGRGWDIDFSVHKSSMYSGIDRLLPWVAMFAGMIGTALLYALFQTLSSSRRRAIVLAEDMTRELRASETKLQRTNENLRRLAGHAESIKECERKRIAREIHDDLGQNLLALRIEVDLLAARTGKRHPRLHARARLMLEQIAATIKSVRQIINDLRPHVLDLGLTAAVDWQIAEFRRRTGLACQFVAHDPDLHVSDRCATTLFRILQESLTNVARHARASSVRVELTGDCDSISMTVSDNGIGLSRAGCQKPGSFGLVGIEERVRILGGRCLVTSSPHAGTTVHILIPSADNLLATAQVTASESESMPAYERSGHAVPTAVDF